MELIVDAARDHIVPILAKQETAYFMLKCLESTFQINNIDKTPALKRQMNYISMNKGESINAFFRITELRNQLSSIGYEIDINDVSVKIIALITKEVDAKAKPFGKYEEAKERI